MRIARRVTAMIATVGTAGIALSGCGAQGQPQGEAVSGPVLVTSDGRVVSAPGCPGDSFTAVESASQVTLHWLVNTTSPCPGEAARVPTDTLRLRAPLGQRALVDGLTGKRVPYVDERQFARVTYVPPGWAPGVPQFWDRDYFLANAGEIKLTQAPGDETAAFQALPGGGQGWATRPVTIRGSHGTLQYDPRAPEDGQFTDVRVVWRAGGFTFCVDAQADYRKASVSEVLRMADGVVLQ
jgi:hypothetical protein